MTYNRKVMSSRPYDRYAVSSRHLGSIMVYDIIDLTAASVTYRGFMSEDRAREQVKKLNVARRRFLGIAERS